MKQQLRGDEAIDFYRDKPGFQLVEHTAAYNGVIFNEAPREEFYSCDATTHSTPEIERTPA